MDSPGWMNYLSNPFGHGIKKWIFELLNQRAIPHEKILDQLTRSIHTAQDYEDFGKFVAEIYEAGYTRCLDQHEAALKQAGINLILKKIEKPQDKQPLF